MPYKTIYELMDKAEELAVELFEVCAYRPREPMFVEHKPNLIKGAKDFWDTYFLGLVGSP